MNEKEMKKLIHAAHDGLLGRRLYAFAEESDKIEGIINDPDEHRDHANRLHTLVHKEEMTVAALINFNRKHGKLRSVHGMNVMVGNHVPHPGGPEILTWLEAIVESANDGKHPFVVHHNFETLHPFMDGNGRTGRALWLWQMVNQHNYRAELLFLHKWYYQSLDRGRT